MSLRQTLQVARLRSLMGWPGALGLAGLGVAMALYFAVLHPAQLRLDAARLGASSLHERITRAGHELNDRNRPVAEQLATFYRIFPSEHDSTDWVGKIAGIARRDGLELQQADYKVTRDKLGKLTRFQMDVPLSGDYPRIRGFLSDLRREAPIVSLEQVEFARKKVGDPNVDAKVRLVIYLENA